MPAPCFCTPQSLQADLSTLGYPQAHDPTAVSPTGRERLHTLYWLACLIDPSYDEDLSEDSLAAFWDRYGLHSHPRNSAGYRIPLTVAGDKQRERNAAGVYLRAAVDLAMAVRRRRELGLVSEEQGDKEPEMSDEDVENDRVLAELIHKRHQLFPSTVGMFGKVEVKKRKPLMVMTRDDNRSYVRGGSKEDTGKPRTREQILERLRELQRETQDLQREHRERDEDLHDNTPAEQDTDLTEEQLSAFAHDCRKLAALVAQFDSLATEALKIRDQRTDLARRDVATERMVNAVAEECEGLERYVRKTFERAARLRTAVSRLRHGRSRLEGLVYNSAIEEVRRQRIRVEAHL